MNPDDIQNLTLASVKASLAAATLRVENRLLDVAGLDDGTTDGKLKTAEDIGYTIDGTVYAKAATDDLWDLSAATDTIAAQYRAYWLYLDDEGVATVAAGSNAASEAAAIAALPAPTATKCVIGVYVAGPETDFNGVAGLATQGTLIEGWPAAVGA